MKKIHIGLIASGIAAMYGAYHLIEKKMRMKHVERYNDSVVKLAEIIKDKPELEELKTELIYVQ